MEGREEEEEEEVVVVERDGRKVSLIMSWIRCEEKREGRREGVRE